MNSSVPQTIVCVGDNDPWFNDLAASAKAEKAAAPERLTWGQFDASPMKFARSNCWAYAYIDKGSHDLDIRLGQLCRSFPYGVLLQLAACVHADDRQLFAYGFQKFDANDVKIARLSHEQNFLNSAERCFQFRLQDYKAVPDWLNARFWAHPERFHL